MKAQLLPLPRPDVWLKRAFSSYSLTLQREGLLPSELLLITSISRQQVFFLGQAQAWHFALLGKFIASTSRFGIGQVKDSNCTPLGLHRVAKKVGGGWPVGTVFKGRLPSGTTWRGMPGATITNRILWLEGMEPRLNQGGMVDTFSRYIYIHGIGDELTLGRPASHGCIHLAGVDLLPLYDFVREKAHVWIGI